MNTYKWSPCIHKDGVLELVLMGSLYTPRWRPCINLDGVFVYTWMESNFIHLKWLLVYTWMKSSNTPRWSPRCTLMDSYFTLGFPAKRVKCFWKISYFPKFVFDFFREKMRNFQEITNAKILQNKYGREIINYQSREFAKSCCWSPCIHLNEVLTPRWSPCINFNGVLVYFSLMKSL